MYLNKKDKEYMKNLVFRAYCLTCNTREKALMEGNFEKHDSLISEEMYLHDLLINKFKMNEDYLYDLKSKMYLNDTY